MHKIAAESDVVIAIVMHKSFDVYKTNFFSKGILIVDEYVTCI